MIGKDGDPNGIAVSFFLRRDCQDVADQQTNTGGGAEVGGSVGTGGGDFAGRDASKINNAPNFHIEIKGEDANTQLILFYMTQFSIRISDAETAIRELRRDQVPVARAGFSDQVARVFAVVFSMLAIVAFVIVVLAAWKSLTGG